jgi:hypothetical protein
VAQRLFVDPPSRRAVRDRVPESTPSRLLAGRDRLGRVEKDAILGAVLAGTAPKPQRAWWWVAVPALAAAALALVVMWPRAKEDDFTARGGGAPVAMFAPSCSDCARGAKLAFDLQGTTGYRYFGAFARSSDGNVIWYWVGKDLVTSLQRGVLDETVVLEASGAYRVYGVFSQQPLDRDAIKALFDDAGNVRETAGVKVVEKDLVVR